jgi:hypothetical protein
VQSSMLWWLVFFYFFGQTGTDVMTLKIFSPKNSAKKWRFLLKAKLIYAKNDHNFGFWERSQFFRRKLMKIADHYIITSTPGVYLRIYVAIVFAPKLMYM